MGLQHLYLVQSNVGIIDIALIFPFSIDLRKKWEQNIRYMLYEYILLMFEIQPLFPYFITLF